MRACAFRVALRVSPALVSAHLDDPGRALQPRETCPRRARRADDLPATRPMVATTERSMKPDPLITAGVLLLLLLAAWLVFGGPL